MFDALAQSAWISRIGWVLIHTLWQFAAVAAAALVLQRILQRRSAAVQYGALLAAMAAFVAAPVITCFLLPPAEPPPLAIAKTAPAADPHEPPTANPTGDAMPIEARPAVLPSSRTPNPQPRAVANAAASSGTTSWWARQADRIRPWLPEIVLLWFGGVFFASMRPLLSWRTMRRLRRTGVSAVGEAIEVAVTRIALRLKIARSVEVLQSALVQTPLVLGYFRPVILLPVCVLSGLSPLQLESILAHELAHIRRHDYLVNLLQTLVETLFFYHPAVWWLSRQIRNERENCCDDVAMSLSTSRAEYGRALLAIEELRAAPTALSLAARGGSLLSRIRRIAGHDAAPSFAASGSILGAVLASLVIFAAATWGAAPKAQTPAADGTVPKWKVVRRSVSGVAGGWMTQDSRGVERSQLLTVLPGYELLAQKAVLAKLKLTAEQEATMFELPTKYNADMMRYIRGASKNASLDEQTRAYLQWQREEKTVIQKRLQEILGPEQIAVLDGCIAAQFAFDRLMVPEYRKNFDFTSEQSDRLLALDGESENRNKQKSEKTTEKLLAVLSPEQRFQLREVGLGPLSHGEHETISVSVEGLSDPLRVITLLPYPDLSDEKTQNELQLTAEQREQVRKILAGSSNATEKLVREQLKLSPEERKKLHEEPKRGGRGGNRARSPQDAAAAREAVAKDRLELWTEFQEQPLVRMSNELRKQFEAILTPEQLAAYQDMAVRTVAEGVLYDALVWNKLNASEEQQAALRRIIEESLAGFALCKLEIGAKLLEVLTPAQRETLQEFREKERQGHATPADKSVPAEKNKNDEKPKTVRGRVLNDAGNPIAGADVWLPISQAGVVSTKWPVVHAKTDPDGRFSLEIPASYRDVAVIWAYAPGRSINTANAYKILKDDKSELEIRLGAESDLSFIVHSPDGKPLAGAAVSPFHVETEVAFMIVPDALLPLLSTKTDANGFAALPAIPRPKLSSVKIDSAEFGDQTVRLISAETGTKTIQLRPAGRVEGRFIAAEPSQVSHVLLILLTHGDSQQEGVALVTTDDQGRFVVPKIATGGLFIDTTVDEKLPNQPELPKDARVNADTTTTIEIPMLPTVAVHGRVQVKGTNQPVPNAEIRLYYGSNRQGAHPITAANGEYTARVLSGDVRQQVIYMPPEYVAVNVDMDKVIPVPADADKFELPLIEAEPAKTITGQLTADQAPKFVDFRVCVIDGKKYYGHGESNENGHFSVGQIPATVDPAKVKYGLIRKKGSTMPEFIGDVIQPEPLVVHLKKAEEPARAPKQSAATPKQPAAPTQSIDVSGQVLDDETGKPVGQFVVQAGLVDKKDPTKITWGYAETRTTSPNSEGTFSQHIDWGAGWRARIIAAGYLPQPIFAKGVPPTATKIDHYIVRLERGKQIAGRVLYHDGKPATDAAVFMIVKEGGGGVQIGDGKAWQSFGPERSEDPTVTRATTDANGRFELPGGGSSAKAIAVSAPNVDLWVVPPPKSDAADDLTIKLPEPGRLIVKYDIDGSPAKVPLSLQMVTWESPPLDPSWNGIDNIHAIDAPNKGELTIDHLPPGKYTLARVMPAEANHSVGRFFDDRREITVRPGKTATAEYIRDRGTAVEGQITGLTKDMLAGIYPGAIVAVRPTKVTEPLESHASMEEPIFDIVVCGPDGKFKTPRLMPGEYAIIAEAFEAEKPENRAMSGIRAPTFLGRTVVTVPEAGPPPSVTIEIRRRDEAPPASPPKKPEEEQKKPPAARESKSAKPDPATSVDESKRRADALAALEKTGLKFGYDGKITNKPIYEVNLQHAKITDDDLKPLEQLPELQNLLLGATAIGDEGMKHIAGLTKLGSLALWDTKVTDAGLANVEKMADLHVLYLNGLSITDAGLEHVVPLKELQVLGLTDCQITDAGLEKLKGLSHLQCLDLRNTQITDAGLENLQGLRRLTSLVLSNTKITDAGLERLKDMNQLDQIVLENTAVTDAGLKHLRGIKDLRELLLNDTKVTAAGIEELQKALPQCKVEWKPPAKKPTTSPSYPAGGYLSAAGAPSAEPEWRYIQISNGKYRLLHDDGVVRALNISDEQVKQFYKLQTARLREREVEWEEKLEKRVAEILSPEQLRTLDEINARDEQIKRLGGHMYYDTASPGAIHAVFQGAKINDPDLEFLRGLPNLVDLNLGGTNVTDEGMKALANLKNLKTLWIAVTKVTDAGLKSLENLPQLSDLGLVELNVTDAGLEHLKRLTELKRLDLRSTKVTDAGIEKLQNLSRLETLLVNRTSVTGNGLEHFLALAWLDLSDTPVTDAGLERLKNLHNLSVLILSNTKITDAGLEHLSSLTAFTAPRAENDESNTGLLILKGTQITDAGLVSLYGLKGLHVVDLTDTQVTDAGIEQLQKALPHCRVDREPPQTAKK
jgi:beta-lactamase regulating signal transducer with metallopeptidase domain/Leucine-rich repeat (LRR) protein